MSTPTPFQWDFERTPCDSNHAALTFSVGVFQWLPKASAKGLKKSKTIRVKGYVADPGRVYEMAEQLCQRLNREHIKAYSRPPWLQKQYTVPRPSDLVIEQATYDLTGSQVRSIRVAVMKERLLPAGFIRAKGGTYVRERHDQIHVVDFQPATFGHKYTVNLGFHYAFVVPFHHRKPTNISNFHLLDCALRARIGQFLPGGHDAWFAYGTSREALRTVLEENVTDCLNVFDSVERTWGDPQRWLASPRTHPDKPWDADDFQLFLACVEIHLERYQSATTRLKRLLDRADWDMRRWFLLSVLEKARRKAN